MSTEMQRRPQDVPIGRRRMLRAGAGSIGGLAAFLPLAANAALEPDPNDVNVTASGTPFPCPIKPGGTLPVKEIEQVMQTTGTVTGGVLDITLGRKDLVVIGPGGFRFFPPFEPHHEFHFQSLETGEAFMNGEVAIVPAELNPTIAALFSTPLVFMANHQHYIGEQPQLFHHHFRGRGEAVELAQSAMKVVRATKTPLPQPKPKTPTTVLPAKQLGEILGGEVTIREDGVVEVDVTRPEEFVEAGVFLLPHMDIQHAILFEPLNTGGTLALCGPDYALRDAEVDPALRKSFLEGFQIHCLYNQHTELEPDLTFSHHLKSGEPLALARSVRKVLDLIDAIAGHKDP